MEKIIFNTDDTKTISKEELFEKLATSSKGLTTEDVQERFDLYGPNEISEKKKNIFLKFLSYFIGPIPFMIEAAAILSGIIGKWSDFAIITILLVFNSVVGFLQENKAENAIELLKEKLSVMARVLRNGKWEQLQAKELVPGDYVRIRPGDSVPADLKLLKGDYIMIDESALTGESLPVEKHIGDVIYAGSIAKQGEMEALVVTTAMNTFFGKTAKLVSEAKTKSHLQEAVMKIGNFLIVIAIILVLVIFIVQILIRGQAIGTTLQFALVLTVAAIPAALPAVLSVTMVVGAIALAKKEAIVSRLLSIEEMAGMDILCSDKTGTITKNELTVAEAIGLDGFSENDVLLCGTYASREENNDPIDNAIIHMAKEKGVLENQNYETLDFQPFDPISKRTEADISADGTKFKVAKGAPQAIASLTEETVDIEEYVNKFAAKGHRALAVARTNAAGKWILVGMIALYDPAREDSAQTIKIAKEMGLDVKMVTGDHTAIAKETCKSINLGTNIIKAETLLNKSDKEAAEMIKQADGFAEVYPEHKYRIVELLQKNGHIVGMTGDGVNDAPALKKADTGIAVAGATDAAKSAAAIVLTKPGLSVIIDAIKQSRKIFERMTNYSIYRIAETIRVLIFMTLAILIYNDYPVTAFMIVLLALFNDFPIMTIASDNVYYSQYPTRWNLKRLLVIASFLGIIGVIHSFFMLFLGLNWTWLNLFNVDPATGNHVAKDALKTFIYLKLSLAGQLTILVARTKSHFWSVKPSKPLLTAIIGTQVVVFTLVLTGVFGNALPQLPIHDVVFLFFEVIAFFLITDFIKVGLYNILEKRNHKKA